MHCPAKRDFFPRFRSLRMYIAAVGFGTVMQIIQFALENFGVIKA